MRMAFERHVLEGSQRELGARRTERGGLREPAQRLRHFDVDEMRCVQLLCGMQYARRETLGEARP